jgi:DNA-binding transcriptional ArsR family regulator
MADYSGMADHSVPDYPLEDTLEIADPAVLRALFEPTRTAIIDLLSERAATTTQLAAALGKPKGTVGHHCKRLESAGLIRVVRTGRVRAIEERYYGRTARTFLITGLHPSGIEPDAFLRQAMAEMAASRESGLAARIEPSVTTLRFARIPPERAAEWAERLGTLGAEFSAQPRSGDVVFGLTLALFPTTRPVLPGGDGPG